ncbi:MAG: SusC/RagA family TonB-linked outer membrane protein [Prevotella sp.]|jgi:TonB-linked SusC/RagA family outer membrane protein
MRTLKIVFVLLLSVVSLQLRAQSQTKQSDSDVLVNITVTDISGEPLAGATVNVEGKPVGVVADVDGKVSLWVPRGRNITVKYLGFHSRTVKVNKPLKGQFVLENDETTLDQVVVNGYQRSTKRRITGSVATVTEKDLKNMPMANIDMLLQGKMAGVDVKALSGRPGESAKIRIRGTNTITGNADPLWVVDGVPLQKDLPTISSNQVRAGDFSDIFANGISGINPSDIESVTVLKDASAAAIYGSRAAGGVIVITTKRGKQGKMSISYSTNFSLTTAPPRDANLMDSRQKLAWEQELWDEFSKPNFEAGGRYPVIGVVGMIRSGYGKYAGMSKAEQDAEIDRLGQHSTNWFDELFRNSVSQSHNLSLSGGSEKSTYYISLGYSNNKGLVKRSDYDRYSITSKIDIKPNKRVKMGFSADMGWQRSHGSSGSVDPFKYAYFANPYERPYDEKGNYSADKTYYSIRSANGSTDFPLPENGFNLMREINETSVKDNNFNLTLIGNMSVNILDNFSFEGLASFSYVTDNTDNFNGRDTYAAWTDRPFDDTLISKRTYSNITQSSTYNRSYNLRGQLHYFNTFNDIHYVSALLGSEIRGQYAKSIFTKRYGYDPVTGNSAIPIYPEGTNIDREKLQQYAHIVDGLSGQSIIEDRFASFYFSLDYVLLKRYILSLTARTDGSNNFGNDQQFNPTGSLGLAWNVDQEQFFEPLKKWMSSLSLRASFGYTGNINKSVSPKLIMDYLGTLRQTDDYSFRIGTIKNAPNPKLRWEKTRDWKLSLDAGFFNERLHFTGEVYNRRTTDAVSSVLVPYTTGFSSQSYNTSTLENTGVEFSLTGNFLKTKDWRGTISANIAYNYNKLVDYKVPVSTLASGVHEGYPLGSIFSGKVQGIDPQLGIYTYERRPDVTFETAADRNYYANYLFYLGTGNAPWNGGYSLSVGYKQLNLSLGGSYSINGKILNNIKSPVNYTDVGEKAVETPPAQINDLYANHLNVRTDAIDRWTPDNPRTDANPRIIDAYGEFIGLKNYTTLSSTITNASMLENVSYFKLSSLSLSYGFDEKLIKRWGLGSLAVSFTMNNIFTITNYTGIDPETPGAVYPLARQFTFGVTVGL